ncbi:MAG: hypothetical protein QXD03_03900 [Candidatus Anstonellales archaeon]
MGIVNRSYKFKEVVVISLVVLIITILGVLEVVYLMDIHNGREVKLFGIRKVTSISKLKERWANTKNTDGFVVVYENGNKNLVLFNRYGEMIECLNYVGNGAYSGVDIRKSDKEAIKFRSSVEKIKDKSILDIASSVLDLADSNTMSMRREDKYIVYTIKLSGWEKIKQIYKDISNEVRDKILSDMKVALNNSKEVEFIFNYYCSEEGLLVSCDVKANGNIYNVWLIDNYRALKEWKLEEGWYGIDITKDNKELLDKELKKVDKLISEVIPVGEEESLQEKK